MRTQKISYGVDYNNTLQKNNVAFTSDMMTIDLGASNQKGNARVDYLDKKGKPLFSYKAFLNYEASRFKDHDDLTTKTAEFLDPKLTMERELKSIKNKLSDESIPEKLKEKLNADAKELEQNLDIYAKRTSRQKKIRGITQFLPATVREKTIQILPNLRDINDKPFEEVDLIPVIKKMQEIGDMKFEKSLKIKFEKGFKIKLENSFDIAKKFMPLKDLAGSAAALASKLAKDPEYGKKLEKGFYAAIVHSGGGFGAATLTSDGSNIEIRTSECGHDPAINYVTGKEVRLGAVGASTPMVIENYATDLGITDAAELKAVKATGMAQIATQKTLNLATGEHGKAIEALLKTGVYEVVNKGSEITTLKVCQNEKFEKSSSLAISAFADNVAQYAISRINRGFNAIFVSGPLAMGLDQKIKEQPVEIKTKNEIGQEIKANVNNMAEAIWARINARAAIDNTITGYKKITNFEIICDKRFSVKDNNEAGAIFLSGETKSLLRRGEVAIFPIDVLKNLSKYTDPSIVRKYFNNPVKNLLQKAIKHL